MNFLIVGNHKQALAFTAEVSVGVRSHSYRGRGRGDVSGARRPDDTEFEGPWLPVHGTPTQPARVSSYLCFVSWVRVPGGSSNASPAVPCRLGACWASRNQPRASSKSDTFRAGSKLRSAACTHSSANARYSSPDMTRSRRTVAGVKPQPEFCTRNSGKPSPFLGSGGK
jgi:hypothetical protein